MMEQFYILAVQGGGCDPVGKYHLDPYYSQGKIAYSSPVEVDNSILKPALGRLTHICDQQVWRDREKLLSHPSGAAWNISSAACLSLQAFKMANAFAKW